MPSTQPTSFESATTNEAKRILPGKSSRLDSASCKIFWNAKLNERPKLFGTNSSERLCIKTLSYQSQLRKTTIWNPSITAYSNLAGLPLPRMGPSLADDAHLQPAPSSLCRAASSPSIQFFSLRSPCLS